METNLETKKPKKGLESTLDTSGAVIYSLAVGATIDTFAGMSILGIAVERASATAINLGTGALYGKWRNFLFRKTVRTRENKHVKETIRKGLFYGASILAGLTATSNQGYSEIADYFVDTGKAQEYIVDLAAFNTFQVPVYATALSIGTLLSEHKIDTAKVSYGVNSLIMISPLIGPTLGIFMDLTRKIFELESAPEKAGIKLKQDEGGQDGSIN